MPPVCPSAEDLKQFRLGRSPAADTPVLEQHLRSCPACAGRLSAITADDPLVLGLRAQRGRPRLRNPLLERVRLETRAVRPPAVEQATAAIGSTHPTIGAIPESVDPTRAAPAGGFDAIRQTYFFLTPPKGPDEMGWVSYYRVLRVLGEGGMGVVFQAEDTRLQRRVALKVMKPLLAADPAARQRFHREARATAALEHDNIIAIHAIDEANGVPYLAMPLLQGETLDERLKRESMLSVAEVLRIGRETAEGLAAAHAKGLIHRDVKPSNIWLEAPTSRVKILDFGLAAMPVPEGEKTLPGTLLGTPGYMAPEQTEGEADARADLFSLGCVLYRMATGQAPFPGQTPMQKIRSTLFESPRPPQEVNPALPGALCHLILRLLARQPQDRPATAVAVARVLETIEGQSGPGRPPVAQVVSASNPLAASAVPVAAVAPASQPLAPPVLDRRWLLLGGGGVAALFLLVLLLAWSPRKRPDVRLPGPDDEDGRAEFVGFARPSARGRLRPATLPTPAEEEVIPNRRLDEYWVTRPRHIDGLKSWGIVAFGGDKGVPLRFEFTADERLLILYRCRVPGTLIPGNLWYQFDPSTCGLELAPFGGVYLDLAKSGRLCARAGKDGVQLWEEGSPSERITLRPPLPSPSYEAAFTPDVGKIVTFDLGSDTWIWYVHEGPIPWGMPESATPTAPTARFWHVHEGSELGSCSAPSLGLLPAVRGWSPDNRTLAVGSPTGFVLFRSPWKEAKIIHRPRGVTALAWSPDAKLLATVGQDHRVWLLDEKGAVAEEVDLPPAASSSLVPAWSPDGRELAIATADRKVVVWDRKVRRVTYRFSGHKRPINAVAFLGDGRTLVSASTGAVRFWDLTKVCLRGTLLNFGDSEWLAISPEGYFRGAEGRFKYQELDRNNKRRDLFYEQFRNLYDWKNQPERVKLSGD